MRRSVCPVQSCRLPLFFRSCAMFVRCQSCNSEPIPVDQLYNVFTASDESEECEWVQWKAAFDEKIGKMSDGRCRIQNRLIDGIFGYQHCVALWPFFETYGVTEKGEPKRLSEMGRQEPIDPSTLGDYAFGIEPEHIDVARYGRDHRATVYLLRMIDAIGRVNAVEPNEGDIVVPVWSEDRSRMNVAAAVSRCCVGREVFARCIFDQTMRSQQQLAEKYKKLDGCYPSRVDQELAGVANVICRPILLLNADPPHIASVYLPLLRRPVDCRNHRGEKRSPVLVAWSDDSHQTLVPVVARTIRAGRSSGIRPIWIPRDWFQSVWGVEDRAMATNMLTEYLDFDAHNRCLVANGKYFKPEFLRRYVEIFENVALMTDSVHPRLTAEYIEDAELPVTDSAGMEVVRLVVEGKLWRCTRCECIRNQVRSDKCSWCGGILRIQCLDGKVCYCDGDHTDTPAPNSWCFTKRKHWYNGMEYDNPPVSLEFWIALKSVVVSEHVHWFCGETDNRLNSDVKKIAEQLATKYVGLGVGITDLITSIELQYGSQMTQSSVLDQRQEHVQATIGEKATARLFDDWLAERDVQRDGFSSDEVCDIDSICHNANGASQNYLERISQLHTALSKEGNTVALEQQVKEADDLQALVDENAFEALASAMKDWEQTKRWRMICSKAECFRLGGLYFHYAVRMGYKKTKHFVLPLLGNVKFSFSKDDDELMVCLPGGHAGVSESIGLIILLGSENPENFPTLQCDQKSEVKS